MKTTLRATLLAFAALAAAPAPAHEFALGDLSIGHPFAFATAPNAPVAGGYLTVANRGATDDVLVEVQTAPDRAGMVPLEPGGLHVMFMRLPAGLEEGAEIPATLVFERAGEIEIVFNVEARGAGMDHGSHGN